MQQPLVQQRAAEPMGQANQVLIVNQEELGDDEDDVNDELEQNEWVLTPFVNEFCENNIKRPLVPVVKQAVPANRKPNYWTFEARYAEQDAENANLKR